MKNALSASAMILAHDIRRNNPTWPFGECLRVSWKAVKLRAALRSGVASFSFLKVSDDTLREACGTVNTAFFSYEYKGTTPAENPMIIRFWDTQAGSFRSCRVDRLISIS